MARFPESDIISLIGEAPPYDLAESLGPDLQLGELLDASGLGDLPMRYGPARGNTELREAIARAHGGSADDVVITVGAMHALFLLAFVLCEPGDEVVAVTPLFPPALGQLDAVSAQVRTLRLSFDRRYRLDPADLRALLSEKTKLVSMASPQNPSGVVVPREVLKEIVRAMREICPHAFLLVDEEYREATYGDNPVEPSAIDLGERVISVASLSKCHGAPGLRIGWAISRDRALCERLTVAKFNTVASCSPIDEALASKVLAQRDRILGERRQRLARGLAAVERWARIHESRVDWIRPDAGAIACIRLKPEVWDDAAVQRFYDAVARENMRVARGSWFGDEARVFRVGFGHLSEGALQAALDRLSEVLRATPA